MSGSWYYMTLNDRSLRSLVEIEVFLEKFALFDSLHLRRTSKSSQARTHFRSSKHLRFNGARTDRCLPLFIGTSPLAARNFSLSQVCLPDVVLDIRDVHPLLNASDSLRL